MNQSKSRSVNAKIVFWPGSCLVFRNGLTPFLFQIDSTYCEQFLVVASGIGALIAFPWWLRNHGSALRYADYAAHYSASSLGVPGIRTTGLYAARFLLEGTGVPLAFVGIAIVAAAVAGLWRARNTLRLTPQVVAAWCLVLAAAPTCLLPLATQNQVIYHASQAVIPLAMGLAILAVDQGWAVSPVKFAVLDATIAIQAALTMAPVFVREEFSGLRTPWTALAAWEQWDWNQLRTLLLATGMTQPSIGYLGAMSVLNPPQIAYPWVRNGERAPDVTWMWRAESGPADLDALVASAGKYDVIVTCPELTAQDRPGENAYNQHNAEFAARLGAAPGFRPPLHLRMGRFHSTDLWVYVRR